jgi:Protein of unknown function (DUF2786)
MTNDAIKEKIKKLLAMAAEGSGTTEDEQASAMALAAALMIKHGIEQNDLPSSDPIKAVKGRFNWERMPEHWIELACAAGVLYGCKATFHGRYGTSGFTFYGRPDNIDAAETTMSWLIQQVDGLYKEEVRSGALKRLERHEKKPFRKNFNCECANRVHARAVALVNNPQLLVQQTGKNALLLKDYFIKLRAEAEEATAHIIGTLKDRPREPGPGSAAGRRAGERVKLRREVEADTGSAP